MKELERKEDKEYSLEKAIGWLERVVSDDSHSNRLGRSRQEFGSSTEGSE